MNTQSIPCNWRDNGLGFFFPWHHKGPLKTARSHSWAQRQEYLWSTATYGPKIWGNFFWVQRDSTVSKLLDLQTVEFNLQYFICSSNPYQELSLSTELEVSPEHHWIWPKNEQKGSVFLFWQVYFHNNHKGHIWIRILKTRKTWHSPRESPNVPLFPSICCFYSSLYSVRMFRYHI